MVCYLATVFRFWSEANKKILGYLAIPVWLISLLCMIANSGALRLPLAVVIIGFMAVGIYTDRKTRHEQPAATQSNGTFLSTDVHILPDFRL